MQRYESGDVVNSDVAGSVIFGIAIGLGIATIALRAYQHGRLRGAEEITEYVAAYKRGIHAARAAARPHVDREARDGQ